MILLIRFLGMLALTFGLMITGTKVVQAATNIVPHKAMYKMSLGHSENGSGVQAIEGTIFFDWQDVCDGWVVQQRTLFHFFYTDGSESKIGSTMMTWESKDGRDFTFYVKRTTDGVEKETYKGKARRDDALAKARFSFPATAKELLLPEGTIFPVEHTLVLLEKARSGERLFSRKVFDGSQDAAADEISAFIGKERQQDKASFPAPELQKNPLLQSSAWPVRMAFYKTTSKASDPDYEMDMMLQANGIATRLEMDYGDFSMIGSLEKVEGSATLSCANVKK